MLPQALRDIHSRVVQTQARVMVEYAEDQVRYEHLMKVDQASTLEEAAVLRTPNGSYLATVLAEAREDYEYEGMKIVTLDTPRW